MLAVTLTFGTTVVPLPSGKNDVSGDDLVPEALAQDMRGEDQLAIIVGVSVNDVSRARAAHQFRLSVE